MAPPAMCGSSVGQRQRGVTGQWQCDMLGCKARITRWHQGEHATLARQPPHRSVLPWCVHSAWEVAIVRAHCHSMAQGRRPGAGVAAGRGRGGLTCMWQCGGVGMARRDGNLSTGAGCAIRPRPRCGPRARSGVAAQQWRHGRTVASEGRQSVELIGALFFYFAFLPLLHLLLSFPLSALIAAKRACYRVHGMATGYCHGCRCQRCSSRPSRDRDGVAWAPLQHAAGEAPPMQRRFIDISDTFAQVEGPTINFTLDRELNDLPQNLYGIRKLKKIRLIGIGNLE
uniref:Uncharacterized protein n=1 Tax=Oryza sativa subsp. japonica TaxID=39947 RepID=Q2QUI1_ORYSJ|nr:hypothetical protein LOC_Os12g16190 [Oryza sativa Japonica Group]